MLRIDTRLERALFAVAVAAAAVLLVTILNDESILSGDMIAIGVAIGVGVYASEGENCDSGGCC